MTRKPVLQSRWLIASQRQGGFTLVELIATITIMILLTSLALPLARKQIIRARETELRRDLRQLREAIDRYKDLADRGLFMSKPDTLNYPPDLDTLVKGVALKNMPRGTYKFLRRIPVDPMTGKAEWGQRAIQDDPDSQSWGGGNVFDVYTKSGGVALDGTKYAEW